jgi:hypothetical protein
MERFKRFSLVAASLMVVLAMVTVLGTKEVHAIVATMVQVANSSANPVPNKDVDNPARQRYVSTCSATADSSGNAYCGLSSPPSGKVLVIETISASLTFGYHSPTIPNPFTLEVDTVQGGPVINFDFVGTELIETPDYNFRVMPAQAARLYSDGGSGLTAIGHTNSVGASIFVSVSGYLVNNP